jgi:hypothetical protein
LVSRSFPVFLSNEASTGGRGHSSRGSFGEHGK